MDIKDKTTKELVADLFWEFDRMTVSGKMALNEIAKRVGVEQEEL